MNRRYAMITFGMLFIAYSVFVAWTIHQYNAYVTNLINHCKTFFPNPEGFVDPHPYIHFWFGQVAIIIGALMLAAVVLLLFPLVSKKRTTSLMLTMILLMPFLLFSSAASTKNATTASSYEEITVNCLLFFDEECTDANQKNSVYNELFDLTPYFILTVGGVFKYSWNITLICLNGQGSWSSPNEPVNWYGETILVDMLQAGIRQKGGVQDPNGIWVWRQSDYVIGNFHYLADLLIFVTGQACDQRGFSHPDWNALAFEITYLGLLISKQALLHEMLHQFYVLHCGNFCLMNPAYVDWTSNLCETCSNTCANNREKWGYKETFVMQLLCSVQGYTTPASNNVYQRLRGTSITIQASTYLGYLFDKWDFFNENGQQYYVYQNPHTFNLDQSVLIRALFKSASSPTQQGGCGGGASRKK